MTDSITAAGLLFSLESCKVLSKKERKSSWSKTKQTAITYIEGHGGFPFVIVLPCGRSYHIKDSETLLRLPIKSVPCPCGDKGHFFIMFKEVFTGDCN